MVRGGYFHSVGHTELNGLAAFLGKIAPGIEWVRCFPAKNTLSPRPVRSDAQSSDAKRTRSAHDGMTGPRLVAEMLSQLAKYRRGTACNLDFVLLIDDGDCRFADQADQDLALKNWLAELTQKVKAVTEQPDLVFFALLAWPEVETWLVADWENGFGKQYPAIRESLHTHIKSCVLHPLTWYQIEEFGGRLVNGSCQCKFSARLQAAFFDKTGCSCTPKLVDVIAHQSSGSSLHYSKQVHGGSMLSRIKPEVVARGCPRFREVHKALAEFSEARRVS